MKKNMFLLLLIVASFCKAQVYEVTPGTNGNRIVLSVINESKINRMGKVKVAIEDKLFGIETKNRVVEAGDINKGESKEVVFAFDAKRIPDVQKDTIKFAISDGTGYCWSKQIVIKYAAPKEYKLEQNYPNPFNPSTTIEYTVPVSGKYSLIVYNLIGQEVRTLMSKDIEAGYYKAVFNSSNLASGVYIYRLTGQNVCLTKKMILLR